MSSSEEESSIFTSDGDILLEFEDPPWVEREKRQKKIEKLTAIVILILILLLIILKSFGYFPENEKSFFNIPIYKPAYKPFNDDLTPKTAFEKECYEYINGDQKGLNDTHCFTRTVYRNRLCCHLGVAPSERFLPHILVIGSNGKVGQEVVLQLKTFNKRVIEVKGINQINMFVWDMYQIFSTINITRVIDVTRGKKELHDTIYNQFWNYRKIPIFRVVDNFISQQGTTQIRINDNEPFNFKYLGRNTTQFYKDIYNCLNNNICQRSLNDTESSKYYVSGKQVANVIVQNLDHLNELISPSLKVFTKDQIWEFMLRFKANKLPRNHILYSAFSKWKEQIRNKYSNVFYSQVYTSTNTGKFVERAQNTLYLINQLLNDYPDISSEYIQFWVKKDSNESFFDIMKVGPELQKRLHVIEVDQEDYAVIKKVLNLTDKDYPEYIFRDIGLRLCQGEVIYAGSEDIYPPPQLMDIMEKRLVSPFIIWRAGFREGAAGNPDDIYKKYYTTLEPPYIRLDTQRNFKFWDHFMFAWGETGDIQGAPRRAIYNMRGYIWGPWVYCADTNFIYDQGLYKFPYLVMHIHPTPHQDHIKISQNAIRFAMDDGPKYRRQMYCEGYPSRNVPGTERPNWGVSYDFQAENGQWGHMVYQLQPIKKEPPYVSKIKFTVKYNNDQNDYTL